MQAIHNIDLASFYDTLVSLAAAFILGGLIGFERQYRQRTAGLRTNVLVAVGAAVFVDMANRLYGHEGAIHVVGYVVSGIGFLGAGVIMREEGNVRGLNTAATLWGSAAAPVQEQIYSWSQHWPPVSSWRPTRSCARLSMRSTGSRWTRRRSR